MKTRYIIYSLLGLAVLLPLLLPGHILTLDMAFAPEIPMPDGTTSSYLFKSFLHFLSLIIPPEIIEKTLFFVILVLSGLGMHRLVHHVNRTETHDSFGTYFAGAFYMINPFTYSRFMAGQYSVLLGYSLVPFFLHALLLFLAKPTWRRVGVVSLWVLLISIVSIHTVGIVMVVTILAVITSIRRNRHRRLHLLAILKHGAVGAVAILLASSYWLVPLLQGKGRTAEAIGTFASGDMAAFATAGGSAMGKLANIIRLQGFWAESRELFILPQERLPAWGLVAIAVWILVIIGGVALWRRGQRQIVAILAGASFIACLLAMGLLNGWISKYVPFFAGYREPHKFVGMIALSFALFAGQGIDILTRHIDKRFGETTASALTGILLVIPLAFTPTMFWGFNNQLQPRHYPQDWFAVNEQLNQDTSDFQVLSLPWHLYMHFGFAGRIIANPTEQFFDKPIISSNDPEYGNATSGNFDTVKQQLKDEILAAAASRTDLGARLAPLGVKYILLANENDVEKYEYLSWQTDLRLIRDTPTMKLYINQAFQEPNHARR